jgi:predicted Rossmann fold nucleotide-binding protein DprA/Smf involved in DNA uptake
VSIPSWIYKVGAIAGFAGFAFAYKQVIQPMFTLLWNKNREAHDQPVWDILKRPNMKVQYWSGGRGIKTPFYSEKEEIPYPVDYLAKQLQRSSASVLASLQRLEKRGKVAEHEDGWLRKY